MRSGVSVTIVAMTVFALATACQKENSPASTTTNTNTAAQATPDQFANARVIFEKDCQSCHGAKGEGGPVKLEDGTKLKVPTLREGHALRHDDSEFTKQITKGGDGMPAFDKKLTPEQIGDLIRFLRHEFQGK